MRGDLPDMDISGIGDEPRRKAQSGQQKRVAARIKSQARQKSHVKRLEASGVVLFRPMVCDDITRVHLLELQRLWEVQEIIVADPDISTEDKMDCIVKTSHAMSKLKDPATIIARQDEYKARVLKEIDGLTAERAEVEMEKRKLQAERAALADELAKLKTVSVL